MTPEVTLTFDNGPEPEATPGVLRVLRDRGLLATFFLIGQKLDDPAGRAAAVRAQAEGHWIGNHTYTHTGPLGDRSGEAGHAEAEIGRTQALIGELAHPDRLFRPVGGGGQLGHHLLSPEARDHLLRQACTCVLWNTVPGDWHDTQGWPDRALKQCLAQPRPVLVLHDLPNGAMRHLDRFLGQLADAGARFRQDFPDDCLAIRRGVPHARLEDWVTAPKPRRSGGRGRRPPSAGRSLAAQA